MTTVARQIIATSVCRGSPSPLASKHPEEDIAPLPTPSPTSYSHAEQQSGHQKPVKTKTVSFSDNRSLPPPPPARTTSSRTSAIPSYKEEVVLLRDKEKQSSPIREETSNSRDLRRLSSSSDMDGSVMSSDGAGYLRQRSNTESQATLSANRDARLPKKAQDKSNGRIINRYNKAQARPIHNKFSMSQPHLNLSELQDFVRPNDRIKKSMFFSDENQDEQDGSFGEDYGSGYQPTLMKISRGTVQKHAVAVTTPIVPPAIVSKLNRAGSDPNILETKSTSPSPKPSPVPKQEPAREPSGKRERLGSVNGTNDTGSLTGSSSIARAYREYLMEKIEKEKHAKSLSPSPSASSADDTPTQGHTHHSNDNSLSAKMQNITPDQLHALDMPDRAFYPRILAPTGTNMDYSQQNQQSVHYNGGASQSVPVQSFQTTTPNSIVANGASNVQYNSFAYATLPRNRQDLNQVQGVNMASQFRAQSVSELYTPQAGNLHSSIGGDHSGQAQAVGSRNLSASQGAVNQLHYPSQGAHETGYLRSQDTPSSERSSEHNWREESLNSQFGGSYSSNVSSLSSSTPNPYSPDSQIDGPGPAAVGTRMGGHNSDESRLDWLPRGVLPQARKPQQTASSHNTTPPGKKSLVAAALEKLTGQNSVNGVRKNIKPPVMPKPVQARRNGAVGKSQNIQEKSAYNVSAQSNVQLSPQHLSRSKHRAQQISTNLLDIRETDEQETKTVRKSSTSEIKFSEYVSINATQFPKRVKISKGFCTGSTEVTMSQGEEFDLHFVQQIKTAHMLDSNDVHYNIPLNSAAKFSVLYNPFGVEKVAMMGFQFKTAAVLMDLKNPPNVVAATLRFDGGRPESSVEPGEILILDGIKNVFHGRLLKAFSLKRNTMKYLDERCAGNFTTLPASIKMTLAQVYEHSMPLPQKVMLYPTSIMAKSIPASLQTSPMLLKQFSMSKTVIATTLTSPVENIPITNLPAISIFLDLDIEVNEVFRTQREVLMMQKRTQSLLDNLSDVPITPYVNMPSTASYVAQCALLQSLDPKLEKYNVETLTPNSITMPPKFMRKSSLKSVSSSGSEVQIEVAVDRNTELRLRLMESNYESLLSKVLAMSEHFKQVSIKVDQVHTYLSKAHSAMDRHRQKQRELERRHSSRSSLSRQHSGESTATSSHPTAPSGGNGYVHSRLRPKHSTEFESEGSGSRSPNDDVFTTKPLSGPRAKPPTLPKPKILQDGIRKRANSANRIRVTRTPSGEHVNEIERGRTSGSVVPIKDVVRRGDSSPILPTTPRALSKSSSSSRDSIDLKDYLLDIPPKGGKKVSEQLQSGSGKEQFHEEMGLDLEEIDAMTDWCSQVEDELTQLYNESILNS